MICKDVVGTEADVRGGAARILPVPLIVTNSSVIATSVPHILFSTIPIPFPKTLSQMDIEPWCYKWNGMGIERSP